VSGGRLYYNPRMPNPYAARVATFTTSIFAEMSRLAVEHQAINLGQGFPDFDGPDEIKAAAIAAIQTGENQYAVSSGQPALRRAIAAHSQRFYGQTVDADTEVTVTSGATEALCAAILGVVNPGDEVLIFEPFYDSYAPNVLMAGGAPRYVPLRPPGAGRADWHFDEAELRAAFGPRTRLIIVNTPHNPTGKVFTAEELELIAALCQEWDALALTDEVYEHLVYGAARHRRLTQAPGMAERTITVSSQGKTFSFTGWKVGWALAAPALTSAVRRAHQFITFATATPLQAASAAALGLDDEYYAALRAEYTARRDFLAAVLGEAGLRVAVPDGTYFIMAEIEPLGFADDVAFCRWLMTEVGVAAIPPSAFYSEAHKGLGQGWARFAFCKRRETLEAAAERLGGLTAKALRRQAGTQS
jgi:N-succinyldiaminopimelate aminotransferase